MKLFFIFLLLMFPIISYSQETDSFTPPCLAFARSDVVFTGTVKSIETDFYSHALFVIDQKFKAPAELKVAVNNELTINYRIHEESDELVVGKRYLIYAYFDKTRNQIFLTLTHHNRSGEIVGDGADYDLKYLNSRINGRHSLSGMLIKLDENDAKTVQITVKDEKGKQLKPKVDRWGRFETKALVPGKYSVELVLPFKVNVEEQNGIIERVSDI